MSEQQTDRTSRELLEEARVEGVDATLNDALRELIEEWRGDIPDDPYRRAIYTQRNRKRLQCARELEELIE